MRWRHVLYVGPVQVKEEWMPDTGEYLYSACTGQCVVVPDPESDPYPVQTETFFQDPDLESDPE